MEPTALLTPQFTALAVDFDCTAPDAIELYSAALKHLISYLYLRKIYMNDRTISYMQKFICKSCNLYHISAKPCTGIALVKTPNVSAIAINKTLWNLCKSQDNIGITTDTLIPMRNNLIQAFIQYNHSFFLGTSELSTAFIKYMRDYSCNCPINSTSGMQCHKDTCGILVRETYYAYGNTLYTLISQHHADDDADDDDDDDDDDDNDDDNDDDDDDADDDNDDDDDDADDDDADDDAATATLPVIPQTYDYTITPKIIKLKEEYTTSMHNLLSEIDAAIASLSM